MKLSEKQIVEFNKNSKFNIDKFGYMTPKKMDNNFDVDFMDAMLNQRNFKPITIENCNIPFPKIPQWTDNNLPDMSKSPIQMGWLCPKCNRVNAPTVLQCFCYNHQSYNDPNQLEITFETHV